MRHSAAAIYMMFAGAGGCQLVSGHCANAQTGATPLQHVVIIMQENRSFDHYFGAFPGADGPPQGVCLPLSVANPMAGCVAPFHDPHDVNSGGPHGGVDAQTDADDGLHSFNMDGFVQVQAIGLSNACAGSGDVVLGVKPATAKTCGAYTPGSERHDVMGYHTDAELPNYWAYARNFVLQDRMFEGVRAYSVTSHLDLTSEWAAVCSNPAMVSTCITSPLPAQPKGNKVLYPWVNLFQLMDANGVSWKYYVASGTEPDCDDDAMSCAPQQQNNGVLSLWNPVGAFASVAAQGPAYLALHNPPLDQFLLDIRNGTLPQVSWIVPSQLFSEHPVAGVTAGQEYVTSLINAVMQSPYWANTAIFVAWDDWGGFYDHVAPPVVDTNTSNSPVQGFGFRVPGLLISAYAKAGSIDHSVLSLDSYATFIEGLFMGGARLDPVALGEPDARPDIRDEITQITFPDGSTEQVGDLMNEFDFTQAPLPPLILSTHIPIGIRASCGSTDPTNVQLCTTSTVRLAWDAVAQGKVAGPFTYQVLRDGVALPKCLLSKTVCIDKNVPSGTHYYTVYSVDQNQVTSPASAATEADVP